MSLKHALLASLLDGEASAYDLTKRFAAAVAEFWSASPAQCYAEVNRLRTSGLVTSREVPATGPPIKRLLSITDAGRDELERHIAGPLKSQSMKNDLLVRVTAMDLSDGDEVLAAVQQTREEALTALARYDGLRRAMLRGRTEAEFIRTTRRIGPYLALECGIGYQSELAAWCGRAEKLIGDRRTRTVRTRSA